MRQPLPPHPGDHAADARRPVQLDDRETYHRLYEGRRRSLRVLSVQDLACPTNIIALIIVVCGLFWLARPSPEEILGLRWADLDSKRAELDQRRGEFRDLFKSELGLAFTGLYRTEGHDAHTFSKQVWRAHQVRRDAQESLLTCVERESRETFGRQIGKLVRKLEETSNVLEFTRYDARLLRAVIGLEGLTSSEYDVALGTDRKTLGVILGGYKFIDDLSSEGGTTRFTFSKLERDINLAILETAPTRVRELAGLTIGGFDADHLGLFLPILKRLGCLRPGLDPAQLSTEDMKGFALRFEDSLVRYKVTDEERKVRLLDLAGDERLQIVLWWAGARAGFLDLDRIITYLWPKQLRTHISQLLRQPIDLFDVGDFEDLVQLMTQPVPRAPGLRFEVETRQEIRARAHTLMQHVLSEMRGEPDEQNDKEERTNQAEERQGQRAGDGALVLAAPTMGDYIYRAVDFWLTYEGDAELTLFVGRSERLCEYARDLDKLRALYSRFEHSARRQRIRDD